METPLSSFSFAISVQVIRIMIQASCSSSKILRDAKRGEHGCELGKTKEELESISQCVVPKIM
jgi:hypothetical protein